MQGIELRKPRVLVAACEAPDRAEIAATLESRGYEVVFAAGGARHKALSGLTPREREVLDLIVLGHGNKTVARMLSISPRTVENHRAQIMRKTHTSNVAGLVHLTLAGE